MPINDVYATITEDEGNGWYKAVTCFGEPIKGVSLLGVEAKLKVNQRVSVWQVRGEFGALGGSGAPSYLLLKDPQVAFQYAPAKTVLAYLAKKADNLKRTLDIGTVTNVSDDEPPTVLIDGKNIGTGPIKPKELSAGDTVLLSVENGAKKVLGWWACVPKKPTTGVSAIVIGRIPYSARCDMTLVTIDNGVFVEGRKVVLRPKSGASNTAFIWTVQTTDAEDYFYSFVQEGKNLGYIDYSYWVKWHKTKFTVEEIDWYEFNAHNPGTPYSLTVDNKFWYSSTWTQTSVLQSDTLESAKYPVLNTGPTTDQWFPIKGRKYKPLP